MGRGTCPTRPPAQDTLTEEEAVAEDGAAFENSTQAVMEVPRELMSDVRALIAERKTPDHE